MFCSLFTRIPGYALDWGWIHQKRLSGLHLPWFEIS